MIKQIMNLFLVRKKSDMDVVFKRQNMFSFVVVLSLFFISPSYSDINSGTNSADCDISTLGVDQGNTRLEAQWQANRITLNWYDNGTRFVPLNNSSSGACTYDDALTVPSDVLTRPGYTFDGWTVREVTPSTQCTMPTGYLSETTYISASKSINQSYCYGSSGWDPAAANGEGDYIYLSDDCNDSAYSHLDWGEWSVTLSSGMVKGRGMCSHKRGDNHSLAWNGNRADWTATESELDGTNNEWQNNCWCKATSYTPNDGDMCNVSNNSSWVFLQAFEGGTNLCTGSCADDCAIMFQTGSAAFRSALFSN